MVKYLSFTFLLLSLFEIIGCASMSNKPISYGKMPTDFKQVESNIVEFLKHDLLDFDSMKNFRVDKIPRKCFWKEHGDGFGLETTYGWCYTYELNSKNRFGGYVGIKQHIWRIYTGGTVARFMTYGSGFAE